MKLFYNGKECMLIPLLVAADPERGFRQESIVEEEDLRKQGSHSEVSKVPSSSS